MSDLGFNKIAGACLATGLAILGLRELADGIYHPNLASKPGYAIAVKEEAAGGGAPAADVPPDWGTVLPTANLQAGEEQSKKCVSCHTFTKGGGNGTGPNQWNLVGRKPGSEPGFAYSSAMTDFGAKTPAWDYQHLYEFLKSPQGYLPGTKMTFVGLSKPEDRINLIAWLHTQADSPAPVPAPNPKAAAAAPAASGSPAVVGAAASSGPAVVGAGAPPTNTAGPVQAPKSGAAAAPTAVKPGPGQAPG